ncbi:hypothetical protein AABM36_05655 [Kocuria sp. KSNUG]|uniref:hypothetical protein n=1 Tax=Kocuria sp. KSNUG TaxID=3136676 RepID=UPI003C30B9EE
MWTGHGDTATVTWLHTPENGRVRALVVLAPPAGLDHARSYRLLRQLAMLLAGAGYCVARVNYRGTGDSHSVHPHDDVVDLWVRNILDAADQARAVCELEGLETYGIGYGVGAALTLRAAEHLDHVIAWEPESGAEFVLRCARRPEVSPDRGAERERVDLPGLRLTAEQTARLCALVSPGAGGCGQHGVQVLRSSHRDRGPFDRGRELDEEPVHPDVLEDLLWALPRPPLQPFAATGRGSVHNEFVAEPGRPCVEEIVAVESRGHCGVLTAPSAPAPGSADDASASKLPAVVLVGGRDGARDERGLWPRVARELAARGVVSLRADGDAAGDRVPLWQDHLLDPRGAGAARAVRDQVRWLGARRPGSVVLVAAGEGAAPARQLAGDPAVADVVLLGPSGRATPTARRGSTAADILSTVHGLWERRPAPAPGSRRLRNEAGSSGILTGDAQERAVRELLALLAHRS